MNRTAAEAAYDYHCYQVDSNDPGPDVDTRQEEPMEAPIFRPIPKPAVLTPAEKQARWEAKQRKRRPGFRYVVLNPHVPYEKKG